MVNAYCTITETPAFRIDVYSPTRGRVRIYAESKGTVSTRAREQYFSFTVESEPPPGPEAQLAPVTLSMSFEQLRAYDEQRYKASLPGCFGGQERQQERHGCLGALAPEADAYRLSNRAFLEHANADWYRVVRDVRALAVQYGREPR
ncbi:MAG: hypothetical protein JWN48_4237 [Myxococcaceae bacterium]|nr:hypothetical protein [Myxococcaceae bacterium]